MTSSFVKKHTHPAFRFDAMVRKRDAKINFAAFMHGLQRKLAGEVMEGQE